MHFFHFFLSFFFFFFSLFFIFLSFSLFFRGGSTFLEGFSFSSGSGAYLVHKTNDSRSDHNGLQAYATISLRCSVGRVGVSGPSGFNVSFGFVHQRLRGLFGLKNTRPRMKRHGSKGICNPFRAWLLWLALGFGSVWVRRVCPKPADSALGFRVYDCHFLPTFCQLLPTFCQPFDNLCQPFANLLPTSCQPFRKLL